MRTLHKLPILPVLIVAALLLSACGAFQSGAAREFIFFPADEPTLEVVETVFNATFETGMSGHICADDGTLDIGDAPGIIGEKNDAVRCEGFWTFNIQGIPQTATVTSAIFDPGPCTVSGTPFAYDDLGFSYVDVGTLDLGDYGAGGPGPPGVKAYSIWSDCPPFGVDMTAYVQARVSGGFAYVQISAGFALPNFQNGVTDAVSYRTGTAPTLTIRYY